MHYDPFYTSRREFISQGLTFLSAASTLPVFLGQTARALAGDDPKPGRRTDSERILVVVQLAGGNDGLNTVIPYEADPYYKLRPRLAIGRKDVLKLKEGVGLHPAAIGLKELFDEGKMAIVQGVGYPNPNRSHFTSMDIWHTADPNLKAHSGWLGRYFDACCAGADPEPVQGVALMGETPLAMQGEKFAPLAFRSPDALTWSGARRDAKAGELFRKLNNVDGDVPAGDSPTAAWLQRAALKAQVGADEIKAAIGGTLSEGRGRFQGRGGELNRSLQMIAKMIQADLPTRIYYASMGGFDTHTGQDGRHRQLMEQFGAAMRTFVDSLEDAKLLDRVMIMTFSEFGRRVEENASGGTDHGEAAPMFLFGTKIRPGVHEKHPDLTRLNRGDLAFGCDFRRVYAALLRDWLKVKPEQVLGSKFQPLALIRA